MAIFKYKVRDKFGKLIKGSIGSDSRDAVAKHFESMGYTPISIEEQSQIQQSWIFRGFGRIKSEDMNLFNRQLFTLVKSGLPLLAALNAVSKQTSSSMLKDAISVIIKDIEGGSSFSSALTRFPLIFDEVYVNTIKAGEMGGNLDDILGRLADLGEHEADTKAKIKSATRYPVIAFTVLVIGCFILITYVIPRFMSIFGRYNTQLPVPTRLLIWLNSAIRSYWYIAILLIALMIFGFKKFTATQYGKKVWDGFRLKVPIFGPLVFMLTMSRFSRIMAIMLKSGIPILRILDMVSHAVGNAVIAEAITEVQKSVNQGRGMADPMAASKIFSPLIVQMVAIGEETGKVDELLLRVSEHYDQQSDYMIKNLTTMIEPILVVVLGCVVLVLALAIFLPMWNMIGLFKG